MHDWYKTAAEAYMTTLRSAYYSGPLYDRPFVVRHPTPGSLHPSAVNKTLERHGLYELGEDRGEPWARHAPDHARTMQPNGKVATAYGHTIYEREPLGRAAGVKLSPWEWARRNLLMDRDTKRATLLFSLPRHYWLGSKNFPSVTHGHFTIRSDSLYLCIVDRACDLIGGLLYDLPWYCSMLDRMLFDLSSHYPELRKGYLTHFAHESAIRQQDRELAGRLLGGT